MNVYIVGYQNPVPYGNAFSRPDPRIGANKTMIPDGDFSAIIKNH